jgi:hypothetical protein
MANPVPFTEEELAAAECMAAEAKTVQTLRRSLAVLIPARTGATLPTTATLLGVKPNRVVVLRREFRTGIRRDPEKQRGGRHHQLLSPDEEEAFLAPWVERAKEGGVLVVPPLHQALEPGRTSGAPLHGVSPPGPTRLAKDRSRYPKSQSGCRGPGRF